jgi:predicted GIY-YIG superfamily endonuclease
MSSRYVEPASDCTEIDLRRSARAFSQDFPLHLNCAEISLMATGQKWLFAPAQPLVERLGRRFFRHAPAKPGVYLMRDRTGAVVYVGKAKNLRQRLRSYCVANPERLPRRHMRLVREVVRIHLDLCRNESAALAREAKLLRELRPRFNRAGVWPGKAQFLTWRFEGQAAQFSVEEIPPLGWERFGPLSGHTPRLMGSLVRLLWLGINPQAGFSDLPHGWTHNRFALPVTIACGPRKAEIQRALENLFWGETEEFSSWLLVCTEADRPAFDRAAMQADLEEINNLIADYREGRPRNGQLALL